MCNLNIFNHKNECHLWNQPKEKIWLCYSVLLESWKLNFYDISRMYKPNLSKKKLDYCLQHAVKLIWNSSLIYKHECNNQGTDPWGFWRHEAADQKSLFDCLLFCWHVDSGLCPRAWQESDARLMLDFCLSHVGPSRWRYSQHIDLDRSDQPARLEIKVGPEKIRKMNSLWQRKCKVEL